MDVLTELEEAPLADQNQLQPDRASDDKNRADQAGPIVKRVFVEPEISQPVDVLEATTFFQLADSGATN